MIALSEKVFIEQFQLELDGQVLTKIKGSLDSKASKLVTRNWLINFVWVCLVVSDRGLYKSFNLDLGISLCYWRFCCLCLGVNILFDCKWLPKTIFCTIFKTNETNCLPCLTRSDPIHHFYVHWGLDLFWVVLFLCHYAHDDWFRRLYTWLGVKLYFTFGFCVLRKKQKSLLNRLF